MAVKNFVIRNQNEEGVWETFYPRTSAQQVITDENQQFISAAKIAEFEGKASNDVATQSTNGLLSAADKIVIDSLSTTVAAAVQAANSYTDGEVAKIIDASPDALNTLRELAEAITLHEDEYDALLSVVGAKATRTELTEGLALKVDQETLTNALALKADAQIVTDALALKADAQTVTDALALKADAQTVTEALATKADQTAVTNALTSKADKEQVSTDIQAAIEASTSATTKTVIGATAPLDSKPGDFWYEIVGE